MPVLVLAAVMTLADATQTKEEGSEYEVACAIWERGGFGSQSFGLELGYITT